MKILNKRQVGIVGILLGSVLILLALFTMVGVGSRDTYAVSANYTCSCPDSSWNRSGNMCYKNVSITTIDPGSLPGYSCESIGIIPGLGKTQYKCTFNDSQKCTCTDGGSLNDSGICVVIGQCPAGTYYIGDRSLSLCPFGSYCPGGYI